jgi:hypothetical protein
MRSNTDCLWRSVMVRAQVSTMKMNILRQSTSEDRLWLIMDAEVTKVIMSFNNLTKVLQWIFRLFSVAVSVP